MNLKTMAFAFATVLLASSCGSSNGSIDGTERDSTERDSTESKATQNEATVGASEMSEDSLEASLEEKVSYLLAFNGVQQLSTNGLAIDGDGYTQGVQDALAGAESAISVEEAEAIFAEFQAKMQSQAQEEYARVQEENRAASEAFLAENSAKEGVQTTESGLQYKIISEGSGEKPSADSTVQVHYVGRLIDGNVFDSSKSRGTPVEFGLQQVITGWTEGLQLMSEGSVYEFYIPAELAYGENGPLSIGPNQTLIFEVELIQANYEAPAA